MPSPLPLLFLGNSYTMNHALDQLVATMLAEGSGQSWEASRLTSGGLTLETHLARVEGEHDDWVTALARPKGRRRAAKTHGCPSPPPPRAAHTTSAKAPARRS